MKKSSNKTITAKNFTEGNFMITSRKKSNKCKIKEMSQRKNTRK